MNKKFNLFLLHQDTDIHPRSWICVGGMNMENLINRIEKNILSSFNTYREELSRKISKKVKCSPNVIKQLLQGKKRFYPIPVILELLSFNKNRKKILKEIEFEAQYLKVNSASAKPIKAVKKLNTNLAKILGAFVADGSLSIQVVIASSEKRNLRKIKSLLTKFKILYSYGKSPSRNQYYTSIQLNKGILKAMNNLIGYASKDLLIQTHYNIELTDEYKDNVEAFNEWIKKEFGINPTKFYKKGNAWRTIFSNKIIARYLMVFFNISPGIKVYSIGEPKIIRNSPFSLRKEFAKGLLMFDGCVTKQKKIVFNIASKNLFESIKDIWDKDGIKFSESFNKKRKHWAISSLANTEKEKLSRYFEPRTQKWKLINWLFGDGKYNKENPIIKDKKSSISFKKILELLQKIKRCDAIFLMNYFKCSHTTVRDHLKILELQKKIKLSNKPAIVGNVGEKTTIFLKKDFHDVLFRKIRAKFVKDQNLATFLGIHKATLSAWKVRRNRIPLHILKDVCKLLDINYTKICNNVEKTDREIVEII